MAASVTRIIKGLEIYDRDGSGEIIDFLVGTGDPNGSVTAPKGSIFIDAASATQYINSDDGTTWLTVATGGGSAAEEGFLRGFVGKSGAGLEFPEYTSTNVVTADSTGTAGDGDNLEEAIGALDAEIGAAVTPETRTNNAISDQAINLNIDALDAAIGNDSQLVSTNYVALANTVYQNLSALDSQLNAVSTGQYWKDCVAVVTADDVSAFAGLTPGFSDTTNQPTLVAGDRVYSTSDDTFYLVVDPGTWTVIEAATTGDTFFAKRNLLDPINQEQGAAFTYNGTSSVKVADFDFELATTINLSGSYAAVNGTVAASETVESAIQKLDGNQQDLTTLSGEAQGAVDHGTFTGDIIQDNRNTHEALQDLETAIEATDPATVTTTTGVGTGPVVLESVLVDEVDLAVWHVYAEHTSDRSQKYGTRVTAMHDGTTTPVADATAVDYGENLFLEFAGNKIPGIAFDVVLAGTGASQTMDLRVSHSAGTIDVTVKRVTALDV